MSEYEVWSAEDCNLELGTDHWEPGTWIVMDVTCMDNATDDFPSKEAAEVEMARIIANHERWAREWQSEIAMEAGMLHGVHAFNEVMGYD